MVHVGSSSFTVSGRSLLPGAQPDDGPIVVWLHGEHDISTDGMLCRTLGKAIALNGASLILDLSEVKLLSASTLRVIVAARDLLRQRSRSLTVRSPSVFVWRVISICRLEDLLAPSPESVDAGTALGSWVTVPGAERAGLPLSLAMPVPAGGPR